MINKNKIKKSQFSVLDSDPKTIAKDLSKLAEGKVTIEDLNRKANKDKEEAKENSNNIIVHTTEDNLVHNYFYYFDLYWDAGDVMSSAVIRYPKTDQGNTQYWITYTGEVDIYIGADVSKDKQKTNSQSSSDAPEVYWSMQGMKPLFRGTVGNVKEYVDVLEIHIDSIGKRFKQKIPDEFRQAFINNQNVRDAFQAICEFLGVKYICPPPTEPPEDEETETESATGDGTENDVTSTSQAEQNMASRAASAMSQAQSQAQSSASSSGTNNPNDPSGSVNGTTGDALNEGTDASLSEAETDSPQNGYADISFDSGGAITHGSSVIETSPDMAETLIALEEHPLQKYLEDTTYVAADIKKLLTGEFFETVHNNIMNYDAISIQPKSSSSSDMSTVGGSSTSTSGTGDTSGSTGTSGNGSSSGSSSAPSGAGYTNTVIPQPSARAIRDHRGTTFIEQERQKNPFAQFFYTRRR